MTFVMRLVVLAWLVAGAGFGAALAQAPAPVSSASPGPPAGRAALEASRVQIEQTEAALRRPTLSTQDLQDLRARIDPVTERLREVVTEIAPQLDAARARLEQLGPKPKEGAAPEGAEILRDRAGRDAALAEVDDTNRLARALLLQAEQLTSQISDRRRAAFASALFERSDSLLSPDLWTSVVRALPRDLRALRVVVEDTAARFESRASPTALTLLGLALGIAIALHLARRRLAPRLIHRPRDATEVAERRRLVAAAGVLMLDALPAIGGSFVLYQLVVVTDLLPPRLLPVLATALRGIAFVVFTQAALDAIFAPGRHGWRLAPLSDAVVSRIVGFVVAFAAIVAFGRVVDALNQAIAAALPLAVATRGAVAVAAALTLAELLRRLSTTEVTDESCLGPYIPTEPEIGGPARLIGWALVAGTVGAALAGYIAFASFLGEQIAWLGTLGAILYLLIPLSDEFVGRTLRDQSRVATSLQANLGLRRKSLEQLGVLAAGLARVVIVIAAVMLALAPWGVESGDITANVRAAFFGFKVGDVTISLSTTMLALILFGLVVGATRILQRWLSATFLPTTELDFGLRNSIQTATGYLGVFAAMAIAFAFLGVGLEKIAIVAGALSVGIGFGLQSIVNNFVSGLILLWERPIRVGDLVVIGDGEGYVRRISVRATEIETFDRSSVIIPNSNLISGVVKNRVRGDRTGRVIVPVQVLRSQDPARAAELLVGCAAAHDDVLKDPPPRVVFKKIGDTWLDFDLVAYVDDVTKQQKVMSDLNFAVFSALVGQGILPPMGPGAMNVGGLEPVQKALQEIGDAIARSRRSPEERPARGPSSAPPLAAE